MLQVSVRWVKRFNSLQTGKHIQRKTGQNRTVLTFKVSIPFKRESRDKDDRLQEIVMNIKVSIPFKRESVSTECVKHLTQKPLPCFNSLQTGKRIQSKFQPLSQCCRGRRVFQFPSNGKAETKQVRTFARRQSD